jgi:hypothetical protein
VTVEAMATKSTGDPVIDALYRAAKDTVEFIDVPALGYLVIDGEGAPGGDAFANAVQALYSVSYGAHFALKKASGQAPRVMGLEALWWVDSAQAQETLEKIAAGQASMTDSDRSQWRWRAMIMQLPPVDAMLIEQAVSAAEATKDLPALTAVRYERWAEGPSAQVLYIGPYDAEQDTIVALHQAIAAHGSRPRGRHHEIYLSDPRRSAPDKLRTILRQPIEPS